VADALDDGAAPDPLVSPRAAVALSPTPLAGEATPQADPSLDLPGLYAEALNAVQAKAPGAVVQMQKVANLGYPRAQFYLAKLYENGESGLKKDLGEARRWTERAARGGEREAMHNFALQQFFGDGGPKDPVGAAQWFRRAADLGLVDSQYNLARLYEDGVGVNRNGAEAYKWYLIAARSGDPDSKASAERVKAKLSPDARAVTERAALSFRPAVAGAAPQAAGSSGDAPVQSVAVAQRALSRLGYYQGPSDGTFSPATRLAIAAYQRDQEMPATGALDQTTLARLEVFTR
jgi:localization factor PodJL